MLEVKNVGYHIGGLTILDSISISFQPGKLSMIIGPNGSGKSSLLKIISNEIHAYSGSVLYESKILSRKDTPQLAKIRAVLSQHSELSFPLSVQEVILMGRYPHFASNPSAHDREVVQEVMIKMDIGHLCERNYLTLSGGEKQKTHFARVLAQIWDIPDQGCRYLFLDEPIAFMDLNFQHEFLRIAKSLADSNTVVVAVIHDLNLAIQYADCIVALNKGKLIAEGLPGNVISPALIEEMYGMKSKLLKHAEVSFPILVTQV
jgi:iron complex transport system ATP-binding protein